MAEGDLGAVFVAPIRPDGRLPFVLAATSLVFVALVVPFPFPGIVAAGLCVVLSYLAVFDARTRRLPDAVVGPLVVAGAVLALVSEVWDAPLAPVVEHSATGPLLASATGLLLGAGLPLVVDVVATAWGGRRGLGGGDIKLLAAIGLFTGPPVLIVIFVASLAGVAVQLLTPGRTSRASTFAFGPYLALATVATVVVSRFVALL